MEAKLISSDKKETIKLGREISKFLFPNSLITLKGDLGAGKTTIVKGIGEGLGIKEDINSPTFNILKCYFNPKGFNLFHIDAYRLEDVNDQIKNIGLEEVIEGDGVCVIERPLFISSLIPKGELEISLHILEENKREIIIKTENSQYTNLFKFLKEKY